ncbi:unnamed protein product [Absidia cylindrospora]
MVFATDNKRQWRPMVASFCLGMLVMVTIQTLFISRTTSTVRQMIEKRGEQQQATGGDGKSNLTSTILQFGDPDAIGWHLGGRTFDQGILMTGEGVNRNGSKFKEDPDVLPLFRSKLADYSGSGYDRGHMAPAGDAVADQTSMDQTFYLSNMSPQIGVGFNRHYWAYFESFARNLTQSFSDVYVFTGPLFLPQPSDKDSKKYTMTYPVLNGNVAVPTHFYKVFLVPDGKKDGSYASAAFVLPNQSIPSKTDLKKFKVDLEVVEKASGLIFFDKLDAKSLGDLCSLITCAIKQFNA